ncbi:glycoside hydrolase family 25 protein [Flavobacterium sp. FlaQc-50]|uniref:glycoside hydrolase family 25 protein n=1 Tax=unclassified Flavobacterium TaxID=196869 RepID=UPI0037579AF8
MDRYKVIVPRLNVRKAPVADFKTQNIISQVTQDMILELEPETNIPNPGLGKWLKDSLGQYYWANGLAKLSATPAAATPPTSTPPAARTPPAPAPTSPSTVSLKGLPTNLPANYQLGVDVSHHNAKPDWAGFVKAGVRFSYIKLSEGVGTPDAKAKENAQNAVSKNIKIGYYHFCRPDTRNGGTVVSDATAEANEALNLMKALPKSNLALVMDLEDQASWDTPLKPADYMLWIKTFASIIQTGMNAGPIIYSRKEYLDRKLPKTHTLSNLKLWISYYPAQPNCLKVTIPNGWTDWAIWQYTESGAIGQNPKIDLNILKDNSVFINP